MADASSIVEKWAKDPALFIQEALKVSSLTTQQKDACKEIKTLVWAKIKSGQGKPMTDKEKEYSKKIGISIMSGKGTGKDAITSMFILWFFCAVFLGR